MPAPWYLVLDACRDNPFKTGTTRSFGGARGLAQGTPPEGVFVLYSPGVGQSALDPMSDSDADPNSVFTRIFLKEIQKKDTPLVAVAKTTQVAMRDLSQTVSHAQVPADYDQIIGQLYLAGESAAPAKGGQDLPATVTKQPKPPMTIASLPVQSQPTPRAVFSNRAFNDYLKRQPQLVRTDLANPNAIANCDRLASYGSDVPDSRAPRVEQSKIRVKEAVPACVSADLPEPGTPRLRAQLGRALLQSPQQARQTGPASTHCLIWRKTATRRRCGGLVFPTPGGLSSGKICVQPCSGFVAPRRRALVLQCRT